MKKKVLLSLFLASILEAQAQTVLADYLVSPQPKRETRAVWLTTLANLDWPKTFARSAESIEQQKKELTDILDRYRKANINTVLLQTRVRAATIYPSAIEPWDHCITGREGQAPAHGYDPLAFAVEECHKRGMEIHAWIATIPVGARNSLGCRTLMRKGFRVRSYSTGTYLDPSDTRVSDYLASICAEITLKYDIDGINLDYIRYPDGWPRPSYKNGDTPENRRSNITQIVRAIHDRIKAIKPWVKLSCSPIGKYSDLSRYSSKNFNARDRVAQEAQEWLRLGLMDQLYPMQYFREENYYPFIADWTENSYGKETVTGLGTYFLDPREGNWLLTDLTREMYVSRSLGMGHAHFRSLFLTSNKQGIYDFECQFNPLPALPPQSSGNKVTPSPTILPENLIVVKSDDGKATVSWQGTSPYYNIYASHEYPVNTDNPQNLLFTRFGGTYIQFTNAAPNLHFAITSMNRFGEESMPLQEQKPQKLKSALMLTNNGTILTLPFISRQADINYYEVLSLQGQPVYRVRKKYIMNNELDISMLSNGIYFLQGYAHKKKAHNFGTFLIRR